MRLMQELHRRRVFQTAALYIVAAWIVLQAASLAFPALNIPESAIRFVWIGAFLGFPVALVFAWRYQLTAKGVQKTQALGAGEAAVHPGLGRRDYLLLGALTLVLAVIVVGVVREIQNAGGSNLSMLGREIPPNSIAVLPLDNLTGDPEEEYLAIALQEALIADLAIVSGLRVTSRTSSGRYVDSKKSIVEIGTELGVAFVVEGTMQRKGENLLLRLLLIDAATDQLLWSDDYDRELKDVLVLQGEVSRTVASELGVRLAQDEQRRLTRSREVDPDVYKLVVKGTYFAKQLDPPSVQRGLELLNQAISLDPREPLAYAGLAFGLNTIGHGINAHDAFPQAKAAAQKAIALDEFSGAGWAALGEAQMYYDWNWDEARASQLKALQLSPSIDQMYAHYAYLLLLYGEVDEAIAVSEKARDLSPLDPLWAGFAAWIYMLEERWEEGHQANAECLTYSPGFPFCLYTEAQLLTAQGRSAEAIELLESGDVNHPFVLWALAPSYAMAGRPDDALRIAERLALQPTARNLLHLSFTYSALGDIDRAFVLLEESYEARADWLPWIVLPNAYGGAIEPLRGDPRYQALVTRFSLPDMQVAQ